MKAKILPFISGAACGAIAMILVSKTGSDPVATQSQEDPAPRSIHPDRQAQKIASLEKKISELQAAADREAVEPPTRAIELDGNKPAVKIFGAGSESSIDLAEMREHVKKAEAERAEKRINASLASLRAALGLSDEQAGQVRALLERREAETADRLGGILEFATSTTSDDPDSKSGEAISALIGAALGSGDEDAEGGDAFDFDQELLALLDGEQSAAYGKYLEAQTENQVEASANRQLAQLQTTVPDLSKEQKDQAFDEFARIARDNVDAGGNGAQSGFDIGKMMAQREAEREAMANILTPAQLELYHSDRSGSISFGSPGGAAVISSKVIINADPGADSVPPAPNDPE